MPELAYRDFFYPLNVFMHILTLEEGGVESLHYGLFDSPGDSIGVAQERSTALLIAQLPPPPAPILEVGIGLGTTLARLTSLGYDAEGITPDEKQVAQARRTHGDALRVRQLAFETFPAHRRFDCVVFQESSQYIHAAALFAKARELTSRVLVLDEFAFGPGQHTLHSMSDFVASAAANGFRVVAETDLSARASPTIDYFTTRIPRYADQLVRDLGLSQEQVTELIDSGSRYADLYRRGVYGYRLVSFRA